MAKTYKLEMPLILNSIASNKNVRDQMNQIASEKVTQSSDKLISQFQSHPVSQEILGGPSASNSSKTLSGYGNLFSFIGFQNGSSPIQDLVSFLREKINLPIKSQPSTQVTKNLIKFTYKVNVPDDAALADKTKMPWESGRSWLYDIERGISGFSNYIYKKLLGRSGGGFEAKNTRMDGTSYKPTSYWSKLYGEFKNNLQK